VLDSFVRAESCGAIVNQNMTRVMDAIDLSISERVCIPLEAIMPEVLRKELEIIPSL